MKKYQNISLLSWNIHQATGASQTPIPDIVYDKLVAYAPDLAVLTEYSGYAPNAREFERKLREAGYQAFRTNVPAGQNDILFLAKSPYTMTPVTEFPNNSRNYYPNYLEMMIEGEGVALTVVGVRIRVLCNGNVADDRGFRLRQMEILNKRLETIGTPCVVIGDFNGREKWMKNNVTASEFSIASGGDTFNFNGYQPCMSKKWSPDVEKRFVDLPLMFRQGDIVHIMGTEEYGIVASPINDAEEEKMLHSGRRSNDFVEFQVVVDLIYRGNKFLSVFAHEHLPPTELEYARLDDGDTRKGVLEYMKKTLYNSSWWGSGGRHKGRIPEVLKKLETVWRQFPDLRFGQLLLSVCAPYNLFTMEDEKLLELLQHNEFPIEE